MRNAVAPVLVAIVTVAVSSRSAHAAVDVSTGGRVETDLFVVDGSPPSALTDGNPKTHYNQFRLDGAEFRVWLPKPATVSSVALIQDISNWSLAYQLEFESADGTVVTVPVDPTSLKTQTLPVVFAKPTAFVDVRVKAAGGQGYGGFAEMTVMGDVVGDDTTAPVISNVNVTAIDSQNATVTWTTDEPATSQLRFSSQSAASTLLPPDTALTIQHAVKVSSAGALAGRIEIRSADASGNRAEKWVDAFAAIKDDFQWGVGGWAFKIDDKWVRGTELYHKDDLRVNFLQEWVGEEDWSKWLTSEGISQIHDAGYRAEIIHLQLSGHTVAEIQAMKAAYLQDIQRLANVIAGSTSGADTLVTLSPEYNQNDVTTWDGWNDIMLSAIDILHATAGVKVGLAVGDWDLNHQIEVSMGRAVAKADYVVYAEMRSSNGNTQAEAYDSVASALRFSHYLARKFLRPVRLGYFMISDYGDWLGVQRDVVVKLCESKARLQAAGTVAVSWMGYLDSPGATGAGGESEAHHGLKYATNVAKPAWYVYQECVKNGPSWLGSDGGPPGALPEATGCSCSLAGRSGKSGACLLALGIVALLVRRRTTAKTNN